MKRLHRRQTLKLITAGGMTLMVGCVPSTVRGSGHSSEGRLSVARLSDFPSVGSAKAVTVAGDDVFIVRIASAEVGGVSSGNIHLVAYSRRCTHLGCTVEMPANGVVNCFCHGSRFNAAKGTVLRGPAGAPLTSVPLELRGEEIFA